MIAPAAAPGVTIQPVDHRLPFHGPSNARPRDDTDSVAPGFTSPPNVSIEVDWPTARYSTRLLMVAHRVKCRRGITRACASAPQARYRSPTAGFQIGVPEDRRVRS